MNKTILKKLYDIVKKDLGHEGSTTTDELEMVCKKYLGDRFIGVFPKDHVNPSMLKNGHSFIANLDDSNMPGTHWVALYTENNKSLIYDSFGRSSVEHTFERALGRDLTSTDDDKEQSLNEINCGLHVAVFCLAAHLYGYEQVKHI